MSIDNALLRPMFIEPGTKKDSLVQWDNVGIMDGFSQGNLKADTGEKLPVHLANVNMELTNDRNANKTNFNMVEANAVTSGGDFSLLPEGFAEGKMDLGVDPEDPRYGEWGGGTVIGLEDIEKKLGYKIWRGSNGRFYVDDTDRPDHNKDVTDQVNALVAQGIDVSKEAPLIPKTGGENVMSLTKPKTEITPEEKRIKAELEKYDPKATAEGYIKEFVGKEPTLQQRFDAMKKIVDSGEQNDDTDLMALRLITDLFTLRSPAEGKWEQAFDIMAQTIGRETERAMIKKQSKSAQDKELAMKAIDQHHASKENALAQQAQFWLQSMGSEVDLMKFGAGMEHDFALEGLRQAGAQYLERLKASLKPEQLKGTAVNLALADDSAPQGYRIGTGIIGEDGKIKKLVGQDPDTQELIYQPISDEDFMIPKESPLNETLSGKPQGKMMDLRLDYYNLQNARDVLSQIVKEEMTAMAEGRSYLGIQGVIDGLKQEAYFTFNDMLRAINPALETKLHNAANDIYIQDMMTEAMGDAGQSPVMRDDEDGIGEFTIEVPKNGIFGEGTEKKVVQASVRDLLSSSYWESVGYDPVFAENKVREQIMIYAVARSMKTTGRLNVDDIKRASMMVDLTGLKSSQNVLAKLRALDNQLNRGQFSIVRVLGDEKLKSNETEINMSVEDIINQGVGAN